MNHNFLVFVFLVALCSCKEDAYEPLHLSKLSHYEMLERARVKDFPNENSVLFKNEFGEIIPVDSLANFYNPEEYTSDWYADKEGMVKELVFRKATDQDLDFHQKLKEAVNYQPPIELVDVDCARQQEILQHVFDTDQSMRINGGEIDQETDRQNLTTVISLIEKCGMPTLEQVSTLQMTAIWVAFQHGDNANRKKYIPLLEKAAQNGDLKATQIALMKDRTLMMDGEPQLYGTQVTKRGNEWVLYDLANPEMVNQRRAEVGLDPLQDYLKQWNIDFTIEQIVE